jgi:hypothetical protein
MQYIIVENQTTVLLGPLFWKPRFIQSEFDDLEISYVVPPVEQGYINVDQAIGNGSSTGIEIFPIVDATVPVIDSVYQTLSGPFYTYSNNEAVSTYTSANLDIGSVQNNLLSKLADARYTKEVAGTNTVINGTTVTLTTDRALRGQWTDLLATVGTSTVNYKFPEGFINVDQTAAQQIVNAVFSYVQTQFTWEQGLAAQIQSANTVAALQTIAQQIPYPPPTPSRPS